MKKNPIGLTITINDNEAFQYNSLESVLTKKGNIVAKYKDAILNIKNGQKIEGYFKMSPKPSLYPKSFENTMKVLSYLGVSSTLIDQEPNKKTKGKYVIVKLSEEQETELNRLKALCENQ